MVRTLREGRQYSVLHCCSLRRFCWWAAVQCITLLFALVLLPVPSLARAHYGYAMVRPCRVGSSQLHTARALRWSCSSPVTAARPNSVHVYVHLTIEYLLILIVHLELSSVIILYFNV